MGNSDLGKLLVDACIGIATVIVLLFLAWAVYYPAMLFVFYLVEGVSR